MFLQAVKVLSNTKKRVH